MGRVWKGHTCVGEGAAGWQEAESIMVQIGNGLRPHGIFYRAPSFSVAETEIYKIVALPRPYN